MVAWLRDWSVRKDVAARLLCFPGAASGGHIYRQWVGLLPPDIGVIGVELPGHGARVDELPPAHLSELVDGQLREQVVPLLDRPLAVFGHSMGALVALELCRRLRAALDWSPLLFVVAACASPDAKHVPAETDRMTDAQLADQLRASGGTSDAILDDPEYARLLFTVVRAEFAMVARYRFVDAAPLMCPIRVYLGTEDSSVTEAATEGWHAVGGMDTRTRMFPGGHFFFLTARDAVTSHLIGDLTGALGAPTAAAAGEILR